MFVQEGTSGYLTLTGHKQEDRGPQRGSFPGHRGALRSLRTAGLRKRCSKPTYPTFHQLRKASSIPGGPQGLAGSQPLLPCGPLTVLLRVQAVQAVGSQEDVGLPLQGLAKRVAALRYHVVKDTARREDVHRVGLKRDGGGEKPSGELASSLCSGEDRSITAASPTLKGPRETRLAYSKRPGPCWPPAKAAGMLAFIAGNVGSRAEALGQEVTGKVREWGDSNCPSIRLNRTIWEVPAACCSHRSSWTNVILHVPQPPRLEFGGCLS